jgi:hypothetical protein
MKKQKDVKGFILDQGTGKCYGLVPKQPWSRVKLSKIRLFVRVSGVRCGFYGQKDEKTASSGRILFQRGDYTPF